jgi:ribonuclease P protein subunit POP4
MTLTPETLTRHELIGLPVRVADARNPDLVGIAGRVVSESMRTLVVRSPESGDAVTGENGGSAVRDRRVPKLGTTFEFVLPDPECAVASDTDDPTGRSASPSDDSTGLDVTDPSDGSDVTDPSDSVESAVGDTPASGATDEAAADRKVSGSSFELPWDTSGTGFSRPAGQSGGCEDGVYVTVDGEKLLSRPAFRTERASDSIWQSD